MDEVDGGTFIVLSPYSCESIEKDRRLLIKDGGWFRILKITETKDDPQYETESIEIKGEGVIEGREKPFLFSMTFDFRSKRGEVEVLNK